MAARIPGVGTDSRWRDRWVGERGSSFMVTVIAISAVTGVVIVIQDETHLRIMGIGCLGLAMAFGFFYALYVAWRHESRHQLAALIEAVKGTESTADDPGFPFEPPLPPSPFALTGVGADRALTNLSGARVGDVTLAITNAKFLAPPLQHLVIEAGQAIRFAVDSPEGIVTVGWFDDRLGERLTQDLLLG